MDSSKGHTRNKIFAQLVLVLGDSTNLAFMRPTPHHKNPCSSVVENNNNNNQNINPTMNNNIGMEVEETVRELGQYFKTGKTKSVSWRKNQLQALLDLVHENEDAISKALNQDLGKHPVEAYRDEVIVLICIMCFP